MLLLFFPANSLEAMAQSGNFFDDVRKELECSVCREQFSEVNDPKVLKCLHTFCKTCLEAWSRKQREGKLSCPTCRQITECPNNNIQCLPSNLFYKQMVEILEAYDGQGQEDSTHCGNCDGKKSLKFYCFDCNCFWCEDCAGAHKKIKVFSSHYVKEIRNFVSSDMQDYARKTNVCKKHKDELRFYCYKCNICICRDCALLEHRDHDFISLDQALENKKSEIGKKMQEVEANCSRLRNRKEFLEKERKRMNNSIDQAANEVHRGAEVCVNLIRQHEATMTEELLKQKGNLQDSFSAQMTALSEKMMEIDSSLEFGKDVIERNNLPEILNIEEILEGRFMELSYSRDEFLVELNFSGVKYVPSDMSSFKNALGKFCYSNTEPSMSVAQDKGLTEGYLGEDSTFTIITKDSQGQTTYSQIDEVNVDIQSLQTRRITKPSITDTKDGCYKVTYRPETAGEFSVSITVAGEAIMGSPFQLRVERGPGI